MEFANPEEYQSKIKQILITEDQIKEALKKAGERINAAYDGAPILLVSILKGAYMFLADLSREITVPCEIGFMAAKSYFEDTNSSGNVQITMDLTQDVSKHHVFIVEDIIDTGRTLNEILKILKIRNPLSLEIITLLDKPERRVKKQVKVDYTCFTIPDEFVVGYGLDYDQRYRNLPYIGVIEQ